MDKDKLREYFGLVGSLIADSGCGSIPEIIELADGKGYEPFNEKGIDYGVYTYGTTLFSLVVENEFVFTIYEICDMTENKKLIKVSSIVGCLNKANKIYRYIDIEN